MNGELRAPFRAKTLPFSPVARKHSQSKAVMDVAGIKEAKRRHQHRVERDLNTNSTKDMWQVIQNVTGDKSRSAPIICPSSRQLPSFLCLKSL